MRDESKLLPCPFCGGEAEIVEDMDGTDRVCRAECRSCRCGTPYEYVAADAAEDWNGRAGRTCSFPIVRDEEELERRKGLTRAEMTTCDIPTCRRCTACGLQLKPYPDMPGWIRHCPSCGARVVRDE